MALEQLLIKGSIKPQKAAEEVDECDGGVDKNIANE